MGRADRLLERRRKQAGFRDSDKTRENFAFSVNPKMNRSLLFDLATAAFIAKREDALFLGPGGARKSHWAQATGQAAILQGYNVLYREAHIPLDELSDAVAESTRKFHIESVATVPLLILDDFGVRKVCKLPQRNCWRSSCADYERCSTLLTSNRPVEDGASCSAMLLPPTPCSIACCTIKHVLKCGPRSWRTKTAAAES